MLAIFDLDNTLLAGDSDHAWGEFLVRHGRVDGEHYRQMNDQFYRQYCEGGLDIIAYSEFVFAVLARHEPAELAAWQAEFMSEVIEPLVLPKAETLVAEHRAAGDTLLIITATNRFVTAPIAARFGVPHLLATEPEMQAGRYTGKVAGTPCFQAGKITRLAQWQQAQGRPAAEGFVFYSDSHNDLPLLERAARPVVVDPDAKLRQAAEQRGWPVISLR